MRRARVKDNIQVLRGALAKLDRHRATISRTEYDGDEDVRDLVEYALLRTLTAALDIVKEWAPPRTWDGPPPRYDAGLWPMEQEGVLDEPTASYLRDCIQVRNDLAHCSISLDRDAVFAIFASAGCLLGFADAVDAYLVAPLEDLEVGAVVTGIVAGFAEYGAFVDLGAGLQGLIHISQMSPHRLGHPTEVLDEHEEVTVRVCAFDAESERLGLALEPLRPNPWLTIEERYPVGSQIRATVVEVRDWRVRLRLEAGVIVDVYGSDLPASRRFPLDSSDLLRIGAVVDAVVLEVSGAARHVRLGELTEPACEAGVEKESQL